MPVLVSWVNMVVVVIVVIADVVGVAVVVRWLEIQMTCKCPEIGKTTSQKSGT